MNKLAEVDDKNIRVAAFSAFLAASKKTEIANKFCQNPLEFIRITKLSYHMKNSNSFITELLKDLSDLPIQWQPSGQSVRGGFQTLGNVFDLGKVVFEVEKNNFRRNRIVL